MARGGRHGARATRRATQVVLGLLFDRALGEPPGDRLHPVVLFGRVMGAVERHAYRPSRVAGVAYAATGATIGALAGGAARSLVAATYVSVAGRALADAADAVRGPLVSGDLDIARHRLPALAGRDPEQLGETELCRAVVESVAENTVDAIVSPAVWAAAFGAPGALVCRAVNTMDAMVGYRDARYERFGWAAARLDDAVNWLPARLTALLVAIVRPRRAGDVLRVVRRDASAHPSPNAGVAEAAFAAALGLRLGGTNRYGGRIENRPQLGDGRQADVTDIERAVELSRDCTVALGLVLVAGAVVCDAVRTRLGGPRQGSDR